VRNIVIIDGFSTGNIKEAFASPDTVSIGIDEVLGKINDISILVEAIIIPIERALKELFIGAILELPIDHLDVAKKFILKATISFRLMQ
jgi:hypothetical protein